jgi:hypothetical protein
MPTRPTRRNDPALIRPERKNKVLRPCDQQEKDAARIIQGRRTRGSGCGKDKGDFKNNFLQGEAKTTGKASIRVSMEVLCKLCREAHSEGRIPLFVLGFDKMPRGFSSDWFALPANVFDAVCEVLSAVRFSKFEEAQRWLARLK